jgi:hypothetical protein
MRPRMTSILCQAALGLAALGGGGCATQGQPGFSIEAETGSRTGNPYEIRLTASGSELKAVLVNHSSAKQVLLHEPHLQASTLELVPPTGSRPKPYDSRMLKKFDTTPYCQLFLTLPPGTKLALGTVRFGKSRDGYTGQWGPFNFDEVPAGDYHAQVVWQSERSQCFDETTRQMRKLPTIWRGVVRSNQIVLHLK